MERTKMQLYEAPSTQVFEVKVEGVVCSSGGTEQFCNGENYGDSDFN